MIPRKGKKTPINVKKSNARTILKGPSSVNPVQLPALTASALLVEVDDSNRYNSDVVANDKVEPEAASSSESGFRTAIEIGPEIEYENESASRSPQLEIDSNVRASIDSSESARDPESQLELPVFGDQPVKLRRLNDSVVGIPVNSPDPISLQASASVASDQEVNIINSILPSPKIYESTSGMRGTTAPKAKTVAYTTGPKGSLVKTQKNPRSKKSYDDFLKQFMALTNYNEAQAKDFIRIFNEWNGVDKQRASGMLYSITQLGANRRLLAQLFNIGSGRYSNILQGVRPQQSRANTLAITQLQKDELNIVRDAIPIDDESYACSHRQYTFYVGDDEITSVQKLFEKYYLQNPAIKGKKMALDTFRKYWSLLHSDIRLKKLREDECDTCMELNLKLKDPSISTLMKTELKEALSMHRDQARNLRQGMREAIHLYGRNLLNLNDDNDSDLQRVVNRLPLFNDDAIEDEHDFLDKSRVWIQCQDFGGNFPLPMYAARRPSGDYFLSNLNLYNFMTSDLSRNVNFITAYDERGMGKDGDAMCSLRLKFYLESFSVVQPQNRPDILFLILDNCVGQNKSQVVFMFFALLSMTAFPGGVVLFFLEKGHSRMPCDRAIAHCRISFKGSNSFLPLHLVELMNGVKNLQADLLDYTDPNALMLEGWEEFFRTEFRPIPYLKTLHGYTKFHCYEFNQGLLHIRFNHNGDVKHTHAFVVDDDAKYSKAKAGEAAANLLSQLFKNGKDFDSATPADVRIRGPQDPLAYLRRQSVRSFSKAKLDSLTDKLRLIPPQYQSYYPQSTDKVIDHNKTVKDINRLNKLHRTPSHEASAASNNSTPKTILSYFKRMASPDATVQVSSTEEESDGESNHDLGDIFDQEITADENLPLSQLTQPFAAEETKLGEPQRDVDEPLAAEETKAAEPQCEVDEILDNEALAAIQATLLQPLQSLAVSKLRLHDKFDDVAPFEYDFMDAKRIAQSYGEAFTWGKSVAAPLFYHRGALQIPGPVWKNNKCSFDSLMMSLLLARIAIKEDAKFQCGNGLHLMAAEFPTLTTTMDAFLNAEISNIEMTDRLLQEFNGMNKSSREWRENDYMGEGLVFDYMVDKLWKQSSPDILIDSQGYFEEAAKESFFRWEKRFTHTCSLCQSSPRDVDHEFSFCLHCCEFEIASSELSFQDLDLSTLPGWVTLYLRRRIDHFKEKCPPCPCGGPIVTSVTHTCLPEMFTVCFYHDNIPANRDDVIRYPDRLDDILNIDGVKYHLNSVCDHGYGHFTNRFFYRGKKCSHDGMRSSGKIRTSLSLISKSKAKILDQSENFFESHYGYIVKKTATVTRNRRDATQANQTGPPPQSQRSGGYKVVMAFYLREREHSI